MRQREWNLESRSEEFYPDYFFQGAVEAEGGVVCYRCGVEVRVYDKTEPRSSLSNGGGGVGGGGGGGGWG